MESNHHQSVDVRAQPRYPTSKLMLFLIWGIIYVEGVLRLPLFISLVIAVVSLTMMLDM